MGEEKKAFNPQKEFPQEFHEPRTMVAGLTLNSDLEVV